MEVRARGEVGKFIIFCRGPWPDPPPLLKEFMTACATAQAAAGQAMPIIRDCKSAHPPEIPYFIGFSVFWRIEWP